MQISVKPGGQAEGRLTVGNTGTEGFRASVEVTPYRVINEQYDASYQLLPGATDVSQWFRLSQTDAHISAGGVLDLTYTIAVPLSAKPGGYQARLFVTTTPTDVTGSVMTHNRAGEELYITVEGQAPSGGAVTAPALPFWSWNGNFTARTIVANTGRMHFDATTTLSVYSVTSRRVQSASFERHILPETRRVLPISWSIATPGLYRIERKTTYLSHTETARQWVMVLSPLFFAGIFCIGGGGIAFAILRRRARKKLS